jgi:hypothetical protein
VTLHEVENTSVHGYEKRSRVEKQDCGVEMISNLVEDQAIKSRIRERGVTFCGISRSPESVGVALCPGFSTWRTVAAASFSTRHACGSNRVTGCPGRAAWSRGLVENRLAGYARLARMNIWGLCAE